jgi:hypothetical protein
MFDKNYFYTKDKTKVEQLSDFVLVAKLGAKPVQPNGKK